MFDFIILVMNRNLVVVLLMLFVISCDTSNVNPVYEFENLETIDEWEKQIDMIGNHAAKLGVTFSQSHPPYDSNIWRADRKLSAEGKVSGTISRSLTFAQRFIISKI